MNVTRQTARKKYQCQHCRGKIVPGQIYCKRMEGGKVHNVMEYIPVTWHAIHAHCQPHEEKGE